MTAFLPDHLDRICRCGHPLIDHFPKFNATRCEHSYRGSGDVVHYCGCEDFVPAGKIPQDDEPIRCVICGNVSQSGGLCDTHMHDVYG